MCNAVLMDRHSQLDSGDKLECAKAMFADPGTKAAIRVLPIVLNRGGHGMSQGREQARGAITPGGATIRLQDKQNAARQTAKPHILFVL